MKVKFKDKEYFKKRLILKGFNNNSLSLKIGKCRQYIGQTLKNGTIGSEAAKKISSLLGEKHEDLFKIE